MTKKLCIDCGLYPKRPPYHRCVWCWLLKQPIEIQVQNATRRLIKAQSVDGHVYRARVPEGEWPEGRRWCSGCQWMIPLHYCRGSRCRACDSKAKHASHVATTYQDMDEKTYQELFAWQGGRCYICARRSLSRRLAVDHDHATGEVRGLLCPDNEWGCNKAILGKITGLAMAERIPLYLRYPPLQQMRAGEPPPQLGYRESSPIVDDEPAPF